MALVHSEEVFHLVPNTGLDLFQLVDKIFYSFALPQSQAFSRDHVNLPVNPWLLRLNLFVLG
jgi:hypothetical protein